MKIAVIGTGYVGLVTGVCLSDYGNTVICIDSNADKIALLKTGKSPIYEPGLEELLRHNIHAGRLSFTSDFTKGCQQSDIIFIAVGTPSLPDGASDLRDYHHVRDQLRQVLSESPSDSFTIFVNKSTVPVGTAMSLESFLLESGISRDRFGVVSNPEFLREGSALEDVFHPERLVLGGKDPRALAKMQELYAPYEAANVPIFISGFETAELIKYAANAFLATKLSFINEIATLCEHLGADVHALAKAIGADSRIGTQFLHTGPGYGGSCFPKDTKALITMGAVFEYPLRLIQATEAVNETQKKVMFYKLKQVFGKDLSHFTIAILGLSFKANTDDVRESAALTVIQLLLATGAQVTVFDPVAMPNARLILKNTVVYCDTVWHCLDQADAVVIMTEWNEFRELDLQLLKEHLRQPYVFDARNLYAPEKMAKHAITYHSLGRAPV